MESFTTACITVAISIIVFSVEKMVERYFERECLKSAFIAELSSIRYLILNRRQQVDFSYLKAHPDVVIYFPVYHNYTQVYSTSVDKLGILGEKETVSSIIKTYSLINGLYDNLKDLEFHSKLEYDYCLRDKLVEGRINEMQQSRLAYVERILKDVDNVLKNIDICLEKLK